MTPERLAEIKARNNDDNYYSWSGDRTAVADLLAEVERLNQERNAYECEVSGLRSSNETMGLLLASLQAGCERWRALQAVRPKHISRGVAVVMLHFEGSVHADLFVNLLLEQDGP